MSDPAATLQDGAFIQRAYTLAERASERGDGPFGALIVCDGEILVEAGNEVHSAADVTRHAERHAIALASREYAERFPSATLYASTEPCVMCAGAIHQAGIGRVVFGVAESDFFAASGRERESLGLRELARACGWELEIVGPVMADDGLRIHREQRGRGD